MSADPVTTRIHEAVADPPERGSARGQSPDWVRDENVLAETPRAEEGWCLLNDIEAFVQRYVAFPSGHSRTAVTLWIEHTHATGAAESTPRLAVLSPEKGSGKTRLLEVLELIVRTPRHAVNMTAAALFRAVDADQPTLLFDEADTYFGPHAAREHDELRGLVNAGHRRGAVAYRVVGKSTEMSVAAFPAFAAVAIAGIGDLPDTILDRSILVRMRRRAPDEHLEDFRRRRVGPIAELLTSRIVRWTDAHLEALSRADPVMPAGLVDRAADVWEPLIAIADEAGGDWPERTRAAALALNAERQSADPSFGVRLLADIRGVFGDRDRMRTAALLEALCGLEESPWGDLRGKALDARGLANRLKKYDIAPGDHRFTDGTAKGYLHADFEDTWRRYLSDVPEGATGATHVGEATEDQPLNCDVAPVAHIAPAPDEKGNVAPRGSTTPSLSTMVPTVREKRSDAINRHYQGLPNNDPRASRMAALIQGVKKREGHANASAFTDDELGELEAILSEPPRVRVESSQVVSLPGPPPAAHFGVSDAEVSAEPSPNERFAIMARRIKELPPDSPKLARVREITSAVRARNQIAPGAPVSGGCFHEPEVARLEGILDGAE